MTAAEILAAAGLAESHWGKRIIAAERLGWFTVVDIREALAWQTCACGKLDPFLSRLDDGMPTDQDLLDFGCAFYANVAGDHFADAARTLIAIEHRAAELLAEAAP